MNNIHQKQSFCASAQIKCIRLNSMETLFACVAFDSMMQCITFRTMLCFSFLTFDTYFIPLVYGKLQIDDGS